MKSKNNFVYINKQMLSDVNKNIDILVESVRIADHVKDIFDYFEKNTGIVISYAVLKRFEKQNLISLKKIKGIYSKGVKVDYSKYLKLSIRKCDSGALRLALEQAGIENICIICGQLPFWNGKKLVLEIDHIDGNVLNNTIENLRILCPHCHSQTPNFRRKKKKKD